MKQIIPLFILSFLVFITNQVALALELIETPVFKDDVTAGKLPSVSNRVPKVPNIIRMKSKNVLPGKHGGKLNVLMGRKNTSYLSTCPLILVLSAVI